MLTKILCNLKPLSAAVIIVQHVPRVFDVSISERLNELASMPVQLAAEGMPLEEGNVYFAPAEVHLVVKDNSILHLDNGEKVNCCCPSIDVTMMSLKKPVFNKIVGVVLTGMGSDGAEGTRHIKSIGGITIAQDKQSSTIYGMPKAAYETGCVDFVFPGDKVAYKIQMLLQE